MEELPRSKEEIRKQEVSEEKALEDSVDAELEAVALDQKIIEYPEISLEVVEKKTRRLFQILCGAILLEVIEYFLFDILRLAGNIAFSNFFAHLYWNLNFHKAVYFLGDISKVLFAVVAYRWIHKVYTAYDFLPMYQEVYGKIYPYVKSVLPSTFVTYLEEKAGPWIIKLTGNRITQERVNRFLESPGAMYGVLNIFALFHFLVMSCLPYLLLYIVGDLYFDLHSYIIVGWLLIFLHFAVWFIILWPIIHTFRPLTDEELAEDIEEEEESIDEEQSTVENI